jgi:Tc toxin complex TcA C-terminal TcB-binding domain
VNCKLTLVSSKIRVDAVANGPDDYMQDSHFVTNLAATQSIVTSSGQNDSGLFELNFRDERYLPFEGAGVISNWLIELPPDCNAFDFETISDVVINLKYTARDGGAALRAAAKQAATLPGPADQASVSTNGVSFPPQNSLVRLFSLRHEFPTEWYKFLNPLAADTAQTMVVALSMERFPFQYRGKKITISEVDLLLKFKDIYDTQRFKTGTPLGDFVNGQGTPGMLNIYVTQGPSQITQRAQSPTRPPQGLRPITLTSNPATLNGGPYGSSSGPLPPILGSWWLQVFTASNYMGSVAATLLDSNNHLVSNVIEDVFMVCHYSAV